MAAWNLGVRRDRVDRFVGGLTYRDGWTFRVEPGVDGEPGILIQYDADDVERPGRTTTLVAWVSAPPIRCEEREWLTVFARSVWHEIAELEAHERLEFLRWNGDPVWSPHPEPGQLAVAPAEPMLAALVDVVLGMA